MIIKRAGTEDIELLIKLRLDFLAEEKGFVSSEEQDAIAKKFETYSYKHLADGDFIAWIAFDDFGQVLSTAFLSIVERPPRAAFSSYLVGTVYNVFTYPACRRKGIATKVMSALIEEAKALHVASVDLLAANDGKPLYENLGFNISSKYVYMKI